MGFDTKTVQELELLAAHLRMQVAQHPRLRLERQQLSDCEKWLAVRRQGSASPPPQPQQLSKTNA